MSNTPVYLRDRHWAAASVLDPAFGKTQDAINARLMAAVGTDSAAAHNAVYRGKNLGTSVTAAQYAAIDAGTFDDLYIGDYWVIGDVNWRIAAFDYYWHTGDTPEATNAVPHHVVVVPDGYLYKAQMHNTAGGSQSTDPEDNSTVGAYIGSDMYTTNLAQAKTIINTAFGSAHVLNHRNLFKNAVGETGYSAPCSWYDSTVDLMNEQNVMGGRNLGYEADTLDRTQFPLFALNPAIISNGKPFWLRDVCATNRFVCIGGTGSQTEAYSSANSGVRPAFCLIAEQAS